MISSSRIAFLNRHIDKESIQLQPVEGLTVGTQV